MAPNPATQHDQAQQTVQANAGWDRASYGLLQLCMHTGAYGSVLCQASVTCAGMQCRASSLRHRESGKSDGHEDVGDSELSGIGQLHARSQLITWWAGTRQQRTPGKAEVHGRLGLLLRTAGLACNGSFLSRPSLQQVTAAAGLTYHRLHHDKRAIECASARIHLSARRKAPLSSMRLLVCIQACSSSNHAQLLSAS